MPMLKPTPALQLQKTMRSAQALLSSGQAIEAMAMFERVLKAVPNDAAVVCGIATIALNLGFLERAAGYMRDAIKRNGTVADYHVILGTALLKTNRLDEATASLRHALMLKPDSAEAHSSLGTILVQQNQPDAAIAHFRRAIAINPRLPDAHHDMGTALKIQGQMNDAVVSLRTAIALAPDLAEAYANLSECLNFLPGATVGLIAQAARRWSDLLHRPASRSAFANDRNPDRVLRIGYVSGNFHTHPVAYFLEAVLAAHDHGAVEVTCYSNNTRKDQVTERLTGLADRWRLIAGMTDDEAEALIRSDAIDILVDLAGHTDPQRLALFARKPAPLQCTWLGYYATTGLPEIDYIIVDRIVVPPGDEIFYTEKPWRMPESYLCFTKPDGPPEVNLLPAIANGFVTFGSCNKATKLNGIVIDLWSRILLAVPESRLVLRASNLSDPRVCNEIVRKFTVAGISSERLTLLGRGSRAEVLATYLSFDIALDPFPYAGGTTTMEALWMGVPVISKRGDRFSGRVSESILTTVGLTEFMVADDAEYIGKTIDLAHDLPRLADLRSRLRTIVAASPLCDAATFVRHLEAAYRQMWREHCARVLEAVA
jgi:protein O-GlcNAc transferase